MYIFTIKFMTKNNYNYCRPEPSVGFFKINFNLFNVSLSLRYPPGLLVF